MASLVRIDLACRFHYSSIAEVGAFMIRRARWEGIVSQLRNLRWELSLGRALVAARLVKVTFDHGCRGRWVPPEQFRCQARETGDIAFGEGTSKRGKCR